MAEEPKIQYAIIFYVTKKLNSIITRFQKGKSERPSRWKGNEKTVFEFNFFDGNNQRKT